MQKNSTPNFKDPDRKARPPLQGNPAMGCIHSDFRDIALPLRLSKGRPVTPLLIALNAFPVLSNAMYKPAPARRGSCPDEVRIERSVVNSFSFNRIPAERGQDRSCGSAGLSLDDSRPSCPVSGQGVWIVFVTQQNLPNGDLVRASIRRTTAVFLGERL